MKMLLAGLLALSSISVFAHPGDNELMTTIDIGSKLIIQKDINIPSHNKILLKDGEFLRYFSQVEGNVPSCRLLVRTKLGRLRC